MRSSHLIRWDIRFQIKYGFYFLYAVLTVLYTVILCILPDGWRDSAAAVIIFSDPAAMGLFFMGAIVLLEKSQRIPCALAVSPVKGTEYVMSKVLSLSAVSLLVAAILALVAGVDELPLVLLGTALSSVIFTLLGIVIATKIVSLNQFLIASVPVELVCFVPALLHLFKVTPAWLGAYPINACMDMVAGRTPSVPGMVMVIALIGGLFVLARGNVLALWRYAGGGKE